MIECLSRVCETWVQSYYWKEGEREINCLTHCRSVGPIYLTCFNTRSIDCVWRGLSAVSLDFFVISLPLVSSGEQQKAYLLCGVCVGPCAVRPGSQRGRKYPRNSSWLPSTIKQVWTGVCVGLGWGVGLGCESWPIMRALVTMDIDPAVLSEVTSPTSLLLPLNINQAVL